MSIYRGRETEVDIVMHCSEPPSRMKNLFLAGGSAARTWFSDVSPHWRLLLLKKIKIALHKIMPPSSSSASND